MAKYKVVKQPGLTDLTDKYEVYRKGWFFWRYLGYEWTLKEAEAKIDRCKKKDTLKSEVIGYY